MLSAVSPLFVPALFALALGISFFLSKLGGGKADETIGGRFIAIDGLRGYLAFSVFIHHSAVWYFFLQTGRWEVPPSHLYTMLGQGGVVLFFMITSFLFVTKLIDAQERKVNWFEFFVVRFVRLSPVYFITMLTLFVFVAIRSDWQLNTSLESIVTAVGKWVTFTIAGKPDINGVDRTSIMVASVTWSLPYEWYFYLLLPILAIVLCGRISLRGGLFSVVAVFTMLEFWTPLPIVLSSFSGGIVAAFVIKNNKIKRLLSGNGFSVVGMLSVGAVMYLPTAFSFLALTLLAVIFIITAAGNNIFGLLSNAAACWLGERSYGIYMLHGLVLYATFYFVLGFEYVRALSPMKYWLVVAIVTPFVLFSAHIVHVAVERPAMLWVRNVLHSRRVIASAKVSKIFS